MFPPTKPVLLLRIWIVFDNHGCEKHRSKLQDLFSKPTCPELKQSQQTVASLLQYYERLIPDGFKRNRIIYMYVSPEEIEILRYDGVEFGVLYNKSGLKEDLIVALAQFS